MKKTLLTLFAVTGMAGLSFAQMVPGNTAFTLNYKNASGTENCLANAAPSNGAIATGNGKFSNTDLTTNYILTSGIVLTSDVSKTTTAFNMFDFPVVVGTGVSALCKTYRDQTGTTALNWTNQSNAKVRIYLHASAESTPLRFWLGHSGGTYYPTNSTYNIGNGSSFIRLFTVGTATTFIDIDYTTESATDWALWSGKNDIDQWGLEYFGAVDGTTVTVEKIVFGSSLITANTSANIVNEQVSLFPNPAKGSFNVDMTAMNNSDAAAVKVMNSNGLVVKEFSTNNPVELVSTEGMNKGIYMVQITSGNKIATKKVVVE